MKKMVWRDAVLYGMIREVFPNRTEFEQRLEKSEGATCCRYLREESQAEWTASAQRNMLGVLEAQQSRPDEAEGRQGLRGGFGQLRIGLADHTEGLAFALSEVEISARTL